MAEKRTSIHGEWSSRWAFIFAATGAAVGLGNIWKFPYITGENGGGAFVFVYLICILIIGIPLLMAEIMIGRRGRRNPVNSMMHLAKEANRHRYWQWLGWLYIASGFLILSYYTVIAGWAMDYIVQSWAGLFEKSSPEQITKLFDNLVHRPLQLIYWHSSVILITIVVIARGVQQGIERAIYIMFPGMLLLLAVIIGYSMQSGYFTVGLDFLFRPDFSKLTSHGTLVALGHAFFTLSLATGSIMMYGAYLPHNASVTRAAISIAFADTMVALVAGMAIFPLVFANHLTPSAGPGLIFQTLPIAFGQMPYGTFFATLFFIMLVFAALTSSISLLEPTVALLVERFKFTRTKAAIASGSLIWLMGLGTVFSFNYWSDITFFGKNFFDCLDYLTANIMLPLGGLFIAIFAAWVVDKGVCREELGLPHGKLYNAWHFTTRYLSPIAIIIIFLDFVGIIDL